CHSHIEFADFFQRLGNGPVQDVEGFALVLYLGHGRGVSHGDFQQPRSEVGEHGAHCPLYILRRDQVSSGFFQPHPLDFGLDRFPFCLLGNQVCLVVPAPQLEVQVLPQHSLEAEQPRPRLAQNTLVPQVAHLPVCDAQNFGDSLGGVQLHSSSPSSPSSTSPVTFMRISSRRWRSSSARRSLSSASRNAPATVAIRPCSLYRASCSLSTRAKGVSLKYIPMFWFAPSCFLSPLPPGTLMSMTLFMMRVSSSMSSYSLILSRIFFPLNLRMPISCLRASTAPRGAPLKTSSSSSESLLKKI